MADSFLLMREVTLLNAVTPVTVTSSTNATPVVVTATSHGFSNGNIVSINGVGTGTSTNGTYAVTSVTSNTFAITNQYTGANIAGNGVGSGGVVALASPLVNISEFNVATLSIDTSGSANFTLKVAGSNGSLATPASVMASQESNVPNFAATQSGSNPYTFMQVVDLDSGAAINGSTGITSAGSDIHKTFEVNVNALKYMTVFFSAWSAGAITAKLTLFKNRY